MLEEVTHCIHTGADKGTATPDQQGLHQTPVGQIQAGLLQPEFQRYLWREGQTGPSRHSALVGNSPSEGLSRPGEEDDEALPTSLSGMARHFHAQRNAKVKRRGQSDSKMGDRYYVTLLWVIYLNTLGLGTSCYCLQPVLNSIVLDQFVTGRNARS